MPEKKSYTIGELAEAADVTPRTIRYYVAEELLPPPEGEGRAASYGDEHRDRLALIKILKDEYLPLQEIRTLLSGLSHQAVVELLEQKRKSGGPLQPASTTAKEYLHRLLKPSAAPGGPGFMRHQVQARQAAPAPPLAGPQPEPSVRGLAQAEPLELRETGPAAPGYGWAETRPAASRWQRIELAPGVELHLREDLAGGSLRQKIEQLIQLARDILK